MNYSTSCPDIQICNIVKGGRGVDYRRNCCKKQVVNILHLAQNTIHLFKGIFKKKWITNTISKKIKVSTGLALHHLRKAFTLFTLLTLIMWLWSMWLSPFPDEKSGLTEAHRGPRMCPDHTTAQSTNTPQKPALFLPSYLFLERLQRYTVSLT